MKKRVLITGSSGMLGIDSVSLLGHTYDIIGTDIVGRKNLLDKAKDFIKCDITDRNAVIDMIKKSKADIVLHTAAWTDVDGCELDAERAMKVNAEGTYNMVLGCKEINALMFYISSDFVFDGAKDEPYREDDELNPLNVYGMSKLKGEEAVRNGLDRYFIIRTSWLFGKNGKNFVDIILDQAERKKELRVVADQFGSPTFTKDLSAAIEKLISISLKNNNLGGIFHFSNNGSCSWYRYAEEIIKIAGKESVMITPITSIELRRPATRPSMSILNTDKYSSICNEKPRDWQLALQDYLINGQEVQKNYVQNFER
jgi:dTDP-4-dehydrorhamnose reductase